MNRRGNSEGTISKRADGRWEAKLALPNGTRRSFYGKTRQDALKKLQAAQKAVSEGLPLGGERETVGSWLQDWLSLSASKVRPRTHIRYSEIVNLHLAPRLGHIRLVRLSPADVERAMKEALEAGQSAQSVAHHRAVLRSALNVAIKHGKLARNAAAFADPPHVPEREYDAITPAKARAILQAVKGHRLEALWTVALACGLRAGESLGLRWTDLDLEGGTLSVQRTLQRIGGAWRFMEPKTKRSRRTIPIPPPVVQALRAHQGRQLLERMQMGPAWEGELWGGLVFTTELGAPLAEDAVLGQFHQALDRAGLPKMRVHDLRHGAASLMGALGVPARVAMEVLGHSQISTTLNRYTHVAPEWEREAVALVGKALWASG